MSHREIVMLSGKLKGMGREADCIIQAVKVTMPGTSEAAYGKTSVHSAPADLPEGRYQVTFAGETMAIQKKSGFWIAAPAM